MRRTLLIILVLLILLLIGGAITANIVLHSDLPRRLVIDLLERETGMHVSIDSLDTSWGGTTVVHNFSATLPLDDVPLLTADTIRLEHNGLIPLVFTQNLVVHEAVVQRPVVTLRRDESNQWNFVRAAEGVARVQAAKSGSPTAPLMLPRLRVEDILVQIERPDGTMQTFDQVSIDGEPVGTLAWQFDAALTPTVRLNGRLAAHPAWQHDTTFEIDDVDDLIEPWFPEWPGDVAAAGRWSGSLHDGSLAGTLELSRLKFDAYEARGVVKARLDDGRITLEPDELVLRIDQDRVDPVRVAGGSIVTDGNNVSIARIEIGARGLAVVADAEWSIPKASGTVSAAWRGREPAWDAAMEGDAFLRIEAADPGRKSVSATINTVVATPSGSVDGLVHLKADGHDWAALRGAGRAERLILRSPDGELNLAGLAAQFSTEWPIIHMAELSVGTEPIEGSGRCNLETLEWSGQFKATGWTLPATLREYAIGAVDLDVVASGTAEKIMIERLNATHGDLTVRATGRYLLADDAVDPLLLDAAVTARIHPTERRPLSGSATATINARGSINPPVLNLTGTMSAREIVITDRALRPMDLAWSGRLIESGLEIAMPRIEMFGGSWEASGTYEFESGALTLEAQGERGSLERMIELAELPVALRGNVDAEVEIAIAELDLDRIQIAGSWRADELHGPGFADAVAQGRILVNGSKVRLEGMRLEHSGGSIAGAADLQLDQPDRVHLDITVDNWALEYVPWKATARVEGEADLVVDLITIGAEGRVNLHGDVHLDGAHLASFDARGMMRERTVTLDQLTVDALAGRGEGDAEIVLSQDKWQDSRLAMTWSNADLQQSHQYFRPRTQVSNDADPDEEASELTTDTPIIEGLIGVSSGRLRIARSTDPRAEEPMEVQLIVDLVGGRLGVVTIESVELSAFFGTERAVLRNAHLRVADGQADIWARLTRHEREPFAHVSVDFEDLDLDQIARFFELSDDPMPGRLSGSVSLGGYPLGPYRLFGSGAVSMRDSELVGLPGFEPLYRLMSLDFSFDEPTGSGEATIRVEGDTVEISRLLYFNRGTDMVARLTIQDIRLGEHSPISGFAAGAARPLKGWDVPGIAQFDRLFGAIQTSAASVRIHGTLDAPQSDVVPFAEVTSALRRILSGSAD